MSEARDIITELAKLYSCQDNLELGVVNSIPITEDQREERTLPQIDQVLSFAPIVIEPEENQTEIKKENQEGAYGTEKFETIDVEMLNTLPVDLNKVKQEEVTPIQPHLQEQFLQNFPIQPYQESEFQPELHPSANYQLWQYQQEEQQQVQMSNKILVLDTSVLSNKGKSQKRRRSSFQRTFDKNFQKISTVQYIDVDFWRKDALIDEREVRLEWFYFKNFRIIAIDGRKLERDYKMERKEVVIKDDKHFELIRKACVVKMKKKLFKKCNKGYVGILQQTPNEFFML